MPLEGKISISMGLSKAISRSATVETPEQRLMLGVIDVACRDAFPPPSSRTGLGSEARDARRFLTTPERIGDVSWLIGVDPEYIERLFWAAEEEYSKRLEARRD